MISHNAQFAGGDEPPILKFQQPGSDGPDPNETITLRSYYERCILPEIEDEQSPNALKEDRIALNHWETLTHNPDIRAINRQHLELLRDGLQRKGNKPATINKTWRELRTMLVDAHEEGFISAVPKIKKKRKLKLVPETSKMQREILTFDEIEELWVACKHATYPAEAEFPAPKMWRVALVLFYVYGPRSLDVFQNLCHANFLLADRLLKFEAMKTRKIQGLPLTEVVIEHLRSIKGFSHRFFNGFNSKGCYLKKERKWKRGYYTTWKTEILPHTSIDQKTEFKNFRESMVTRYNGLKGGLGSWIAGHYVPGVSAQSYDLPNQEIRDAIEAAPVPACFHDFQK